MWQLCAFSIYPLPALKTNKRNKKEMDKVSYALGLGIGSQLTSMGAESLNIDDFAQAIKDYIAGKPA